MAGEYNLTNTILKRFLGKIKVSCECWEWLASKDKDNYGFFKCFGKQRKAHRISFWIFISKFDLDDSDIMICHHCDNPKCVRPDHLFLGNHLLNVEDQKSKGRTLKGRKNGQAKLYPNQVLEIRKRYSDGESQQSIGNVYNVSQVQISRIILNRNWLEV